MTRPNLKSLLLAAGLATAAGAAGAQEKIALIMSDIGSANPFWAAVGQGAMDKGEELGVDVAVVGPPGGETDITGQIALIEDQIAKGVSGIAIAPSDTAAVVPALERAIERGVHVVYIDKTAELDLPYFGTQNVAAAELGAQYICDNVPDGANVAILQGIASTTAGRDRAIGARSGLEGCGLNIVAEQPADWDTAMALSVTENILTANPDLAAIFASNDNMALGAVEAARNAGRLDDLFIVGFDGNPNAAEAIIAGDLEASVAQRPYMMGQMGVESVLKLIEGEEIPDVVDTGAELVTPENAEEYL